MSMIYKLLIAAAIFLTAVTVFWYWPRLSHRDGDMHDPRSEIHAAVIGDEIYVAGGIGFFRTLDSCERYKINERRWHRCANLPRALHHVAIASDGQRLYASGGYVGLPFRQDLKAALFSYDPTADRWSELAPLPHPIGQHAMAWYSDSLYLVGGQDGDRDLSTLWAYDLANGEWSALAPMPTARHSHAIAVTDDTLYVAGGRSAALGTEIDRVEAYDFAADQWRTLPPMPQGCGGHAAFATAGELHVVGGEDLTTVNVLTRHDVLDLERLEWREGSPLSRARHGLASTVAGGVAYAIGGGASAGLHTIYSVSGEIFPIDTNHKAF